MKKLGILLFSLIAGYQFIYAQKNDILKSRDYPQGYFRNPLNIPMDASGVFGDLRSTHFHAGDDYRTQQKIGLPLYAAAAGYVSRVRVQIGGGGLSLYIDHPNGFTTTYLHMDRFNDELADIIRPEQFKQQRYDVDITLPPNKVMLTKGQYIGNAGNTGGSAGPHLHFEIRDTKTQNPLNPQLFGLRFTDNFKPIINSAMLYDLNDELFNENTPRKTLNVKASTTGNYSLTQTNPIPVAGKFGLGINTFDRHRTGGFTNGVYSIELFVDGEAISTAVFEELDFNTSRGIYSYIDYPHFKKSKNKIQKSFKDPGNKIEIFKTLKNRGVIELPENKVYAVKYVVKDIAGNCSELNFQVENTISQNINTPIRTGKQLLNYDSENTFATDNVRISIPKGALYDNIDFNYTETISQPKSYSGTHHIHNTLTPVFSAYSVSIKAEDLPKHLENKALIASTENGAEGGKFEDGWVTANTRNFGSFYIVVDTIAPTITARNLTNGKNLTNQNRIDFTISDNLSGIQSFNGYIDDQWILMEYDSKNKHLWHTFVPDLPKGEHTFKLIVKDWKDNENIYQATFIR